MPQTCLLHIAEFTEEFLPQIAEMFEIHLIQIASLPKVCLPQVAEFSKVGLLRILGLPEAFLLRIVFITRYIGLSNLNYYGGHANNLLRVHYIYSDIYLVI